MFLKKKKKIPIYCNAQTKKRLLKSYPWLFKSKKYYPQIMSIKNTKNNFTIKKGKNKIEFQSLNVKHGIVDTRGYLFNNIAYISDCKTIPKKTLLKLKLYGYILVTTPARKLTQQIHLLIKGLT